MQRFACLEVRTVCNRCGQSIPVNGPYAEVTCGACFGRQTVPADIVGDFINDFEEEYQGISEGQGRGGTLMSGSGTYKYGYWRLRPRCSSCKEQLEIPEGPGPVVIECAGCHEKYHYFEAPEPLRKEVPSAAFCITPEAPPGPDGVERLQIDQSSSKPIVMSCPQCGGTLSVSSSSERIMECGYCGSEVYVPDEVWSSLHPVRTSEEWFVGLHGKNVHQLRAERRRADEKSDEEFLRGWKLRNAPRKAKKSIRSFLPIILLVFLAAIIVTLTGALSDDGTGGLGDAWSRIGPYLIVPLVVLVPILLAVKSTISSRIGRGKRSKEALTLLCRKHDWKHQAAEYAGTQGYVDAKYRGRDIEIHPDSDYALEVEIHDSGFHLKTEPPGYPGDEVRRFVSGDRRFDDLFPIRYAVPELADRIESSKDEADEVLAPLYWYVRRWGGRLGRLKVDWSGVAVHITPGHRDLMDAGNRYVLPEDLEPLLEDTVTLASAIDAVTSGRKPALPEDGPRSTAGTGTPSDQKQP